MNKGDIVLIPFPFTDLTGTKTRPALILAYSDLDVPVAFITAQTKWKEFDFELTPSALNGHKSQSLLRINKLATVDKSLALGKLGELSKIEIETVNSQLRKLLKLG